MARMTVDEFVNAANLCRLVVTGCYIPCWLAPSGEVVTGSSHWDIAQAELGGGYAEMFDAGFMRLVPDRRREGLSVEADGCCTKLTPEMLKALNQLLKVFKVSKTSFSCVDIHGLDALEVKSDVDLLRVLTAGLV